MWSRYAGPATIVFASEPDGPVLVVRGCVEAIALNSFAGAMEDVLKNHDLHSLSSTLYTLLLFFPQSFFFARTTSYQV